MSARRWDGTSVDSPLGIRTVLAVTSALLLACAGSAPARMPPPETAEAGSAPPFESEITEGCYHIYARASTNGKGFLQPHRAGSAGAHYYATADQRDPASRFFLKQTGGDTFLILDAGTDIDEYISYYLSEGPAHTDWVVRQKHLRPRDQREWAEWRLAPKTGAPGVFYIQSTNPHPTRRRYLRCGLDHAIGLQDSARDWEEFSFAKAKSCWKPSQVHVGADFIVKPTGPAKPVWGIADLHSHAFSNEGFGGRAFQGAPFHPWGMDAALQACDCPLGRAELSACAGGALEGAAHGPGGALDNVGNLLDGTIGGHLIGGIPELDGWPRWNGSTHQQMYYEWLDRAHRGGLRLQVLLAVNNELFCQLANREVGYRCDDMWAVDRQLEMAYALQAFIDQEHGGEGKGWLRIVKSPAEARRVISEGKLAVVLGIEVDFLFGCKNEDSCVALAQQIKKYRDKGVRYIFPIHVFDNAFGGAAVYNPVFNVGNRLLHGTDRWFEVERCENEGYEHNASLLGFPWDAMVNLITRLFGLGSFPDYGPGAHCNARGLTPLGEVLIRELMRQKIIIDVDHISRKTLARVLEITGEESYPVVSGHTGFIATSIGQGKAESQKTEAQARAIWRSGGVVAPILHQGGVKQIVEHRSGKVPFTCDQSSQAWAQVYLHVMTAAREAGAYGVPMGTDANGVIHMPAPRHPDGHWPCGKNDEQARRQKNFVEYPFTARDPSNPNGKFDHLRSGRLDREAGHKGLRTYDYNKDGWANIGLLPDFLEDLRKVGLSDEDLKPLFNSAEAFLRTWEKIEGAE